MTKKELYQLVEMKVDELFHQYQVANGIESGDIDPHELMELEELQERLTNLIIKTNEGNE